jgi:hypothetical protein
MVFVTDGSDASESYPRYIVKLQNTSAAGMDERECPLCHEKLRYSGKKTYGLFGTPEPSESGAQ